MKKILKITLGLLLLSSSLYAEVISDFIDMKNCNKQDKTYYKICWDDVHNVPVSGWTTIDGELSTTTNIKSRPSFYKNKTVKTMAPEDIQMPDERGHTFANDSDNDYDKVALKSTYDMINITPMLSSINVGIWRKVENRGKFLAKTLGEVESITLVEYNETTKNNYLYPKSYTRIYIGEDTTECYRVENIPQEFKKLSEYQISCENLLLHKEGF